MSTKKLYLLTVIVGVIWGLADIYLNDADGDSSREAMVAAEFSATNYPSGDVWLIDDEKILDFGAVDIRRHEEEESGVVSMEGLRVALEGAASEGRRIDLIFPNVVELYCYFDGFKAIRSISAPKLELAYSYAFCGIEGLERLELSTEEGVVLEMDQCDSCGNEVTQYDLRGVELVMGVANMRNIRDGRRLYLPPVDLVFRSVQLVGVDGEEADMGYEPIAEDAPLSEYRHNRYPESSRWVIAERDIASGDMRGFYSALFSAEQEGRLIDLEFTNVERFGAGVECRERLYFGIRPLYEIIGCRAVRSVRMPKAKLVGARSFAGCENLVSAEMPLAEELGQMAFWGCGRLESIDLHNLRKVDWFAFEFCESLTSIDLPLLRSVSFGAFGGCKSLRNISLATADGVALEEIGSMEFAEVNYEEIDLVLGAANSEFVEGAKLSKDDFSEIFNTIIVK